MHSAFELSLETDGISQSFLLGEGEIRAGRQTIPPPSNSKKLKKIAVIPAWSNRKVLNPYNKINPRNAT